MWMGGGGVYVCVCVGGGGGLPNVACRFSGPGLIPGSWIMMRHVSCILLLEWSTTSQRLWVYRISVPYAQKEPRFLFEKRRGQPREFWSLISTIDVSTPETLYHRGDALLYIAYVMLIWAAPIPDDRWHCSLWP